MAEISELTKAWATEQLWERIRDLADDPYGVCENDLVLLEEIWKNYTVIAQDLNCDAVKIVDAVATPYERSRLLSMLKI